SISSRNLSLYERILRAHEILFPDRLARVFGWCESNSEREKQWAARNCCCAFTRPGVSCSLRCAVFFATLRVMDTNIGRFFLVARKSFRFKFIAGFLIAIP